MGNEQYSLSAFLWQFIKKYKIGLFLIQIFCLVWAADQTLWPYIMKVLVDNISSFKGDPKDVYSVISNIIIFGCISWIIIEAGYRLSGILMAKILPKIEADIRLGMFEYVQRHSQTFFAKQQIGAISNKIADMPKSASHIILLVTSFFVPGFLTFLVACQIFYNLHYLFALTLSAWIISHLAISIYFSKSCDNYTKTHAQARSTLAGKIVDSLSNSLNVKLFSRYRHETEFLRIFQDDERIKHTEALLYIEKLRFILSFICFIGMGVAIIYLTIYSWQNALITLGDVVLILQTTLNLISLLWIISMELPNLFKEIGICKQALTLINVKHDINDMPQPKNLIVTDGEIVFDNVTFFYDEKNSIFTNKNIILQAGSKTGLVGFSGSGKTTFVNLILRFHNVNNGKILIDNQDIAKVSQESLRSSISMIPQESVLFNRSIMENIRYGRLNASDEEVIEAAKFAHAHDFIMKLRNGYETKAGERGNRLSGGQKQRISIARAILKNSPILILDEATSALDSVTENLIQDSLDYLMKSKTTIAIAHRLSTLNNMDRILVFNQGKIVEDGKPTDLIAKKGYFYKLWMLQSNKTLS